jgi:hypothetical protein
VNSDQSSAVGEEQDYDEDEEEDYEHEYEMSALPSFSCS